MDEEQARQTLTERREEIERLIAISEKATEPVKLEQDAVGRLSRIDAIAVQSMAIAQQQRRRDELRRIDAALARIEEGEWGYCLTCGDRIEEPRLAHDPAVTRCIACAGGKGEHR